MLGRVRDAGPIALAVACLLAATWHTLRHTQLLAQSEPGGGAARTATAAPALITVDPSIPLTGSGSPSEACQLPAYRGAPPWAGWALIEGPRVRAEGGTESLPVYAARISEGVALLVANHTALPASFRVEVRLSGGVYTTDRLVFDLQNPETPTRIERLESMVIAGPGRLVKPGVLAPGHAAVYRFTNRSARTLSAFYAVKERIRPFAEARQAEYRRMMTPLRECENHIAALSHGIAPGQRYDVLDHIHRALLTVAHAGALCANFRNQGRLADEGGNILGDALARLEDELSALSAGCLNLVPDLEIVASDAHRPTVRQVTVSLTNAGSRSVSLVRIGADGPPGSSVQPADQAMFGAVRPGETVRATFTVRLAEAADPRSIEAEIAYYTAGAPAHLRLNRI